MLRWKSVSFVMVVLVCGLPVATSLATDPGCLANEYKAGSECVELGDEARLSYWKGKSPRKASKTGLTVQRDEPTEIIVFGPFGRISSDEPEWSRTRLVPGLYDIRVLAEGKVIYRRKAVVELSRITRLDARGAGAGAAPVGKSILIFGERYHLGGGVAALTPRDPGGIDLKAMCMEPRTNRVGFECVRPRPGNPDSLKLVQSVVNTVVLHADLSPDPLQTAKNLAHRDLPLSTHFVINWDGTIYQFADAAARTSHGGAVNGRSIGIDLNTLGLNLRRSRPLPRAERKMLETQCEGGDDDACETLQSDSQKVKRLSDWQALMRSRGEVRPVSKVKKIQGYPTQSYGYTAVQYHALIELLKVLTAAFPRITPQVPRDSKGRIIMGKVRGLMPTGITAHWHYSDQRWDPGPGFEWDRVLKPLQKAVKARPL